MGSVPQSPFMPQRQSTQPVDMIGDLPDIDFFSIPVDDFYEDYVTELGTRNSRRLSGAMPSYVDNLTSGFAGTTPMAVESTSAQPQQSLRQPSAMPNSTFFPGTSDQLGASSQQQYHPANLARLNTSFQTGMPAIPTTAAQTGMYTSGSPPQNGSGASDFSLDEDLTTDRHQRPGNTRRANGKLNARETKTKRNPKQQMQNKQAQQRYRERRKQKFVEMEQAIDALAAQTKDMNSLQNQHHMLQGRTTELEQILRHKELEIQRLQQQLESKKSDGSSDSSVDVCAAVELDEDPSAAYANEAERKHRSHEAEVQAYQHDWQQHVLRLKNYFERQGLQNVHPSACECSQTLHGNTSPNQSCADVQTKRSNISTLQNAAGEGVDPAVMNEVAKMVAQSCSTCSKAMRAEGVQVMELMGRAMGQLTHIECSVKRQKWTQVLQALKLTPDQREQLMSNRKEHLNKLRRIFEDRQELNMQAMGLMLPQSGDCPEGQAKSSLEGKLDCMSLNGYGSTARENVDLNSVLDKIKCNLRKEQRTVMELSFITMHRILSPLQCAWFFLEAFPAHCDCLALANVLAFQLKREDSFDRTGSASHDHTANSANGSNSGSGAAESLVEKPMQSDDAPRSESHSNSSCK